MGPHSSLLAGHANYLTVQQHITRDNKMQYN